MATTHGCRLRSKLPNHHTHKLETLVAGDADALMYSRLVDAQYLRLTAINTRDMRPRRRGVPVMAVSARCSPALVQIHEAEPGA